MVKDERQSFRMTQDAPLYINKNEKLIKVGTFYKGSIFERVQDYGKWHKLQYDEQFGYIWKDATELVIYQFNGLPLYGKFMLINEANLYINTNEKPIGIINSGQIIPRAEKVNANWVMTFLGGRALFIKASDVVDLTRPFNKEGHK